MGRWYDCTNARGLRVSPDASPPESADDPSIETKEINDMTDWTNQTPWSSLNGLCADVEYTY